MQWDGGQTSGFSTSKPWLLLAENYVIENVAEQQREPHSLYRLYRQLIEIRKSHAALQRGSYRLIAATRDLLLYLREFKNDRVLVGLNLGGEPTAVTLAPQMAGYVLLSSHFDRENESLSGDLALRPHEGIVINCQSS
jgi:alpha-glucosidase